MLSEVLTRPISPDSKCTYSRFYLQHDETVQVMNVLEPGGPSEAASKPVHPVDEMLAFRPRPDRSD